MVSDRILIHEIAVIDDLFKKKEDGSQMIEEFKGRRTGHIIRRGGREVKAMDC